MINFIKDLISFIKFKKIEKKYNYCFFCENRFVFEHMEPAIQIKKINKKILIISFDNLNFKSKENIENFIFFTKFFKSLIFITLKIKYIYSSTPGLNSTLFVKSKNKNCKYLYLQHSPINLTRNYNEGAFNNFDAVQVISEFQYKEMDEIKKINNLKTKIFKNKYLYLKNKFQDDAKEKFLFDVLIAPTWNTDFYQKNTHIELIKKLEENNMTYKIRPHYMSFKKKEIKKDDINDLNFDKNPKVNIFEFNFLISDWSGIFIEYIILRNRKPYLVNSKKKVLNQNYENYKNQPAEDTMRSKISHNYKLDDILKLVNDMKKNSHNINEINIREKNDLNDYVSKFYI